MTTLRLVVNGTAVTADIPPRTHLADLLREELLLTGTHLGCEQGVCGACTVLLDGAPARACITYPALLGACEVRTIEGLEDDMVMVALRAAFSAAHALQCGYCTPGMLVTARDIVLRLPRADDDRIHTAGAGRPAGRRTCRGTGARPAIGRHPGCIAYRGTGPSCYTGAGADARPDFARSASGI